MRILLTAMLVAGADETTIQLLLNAAAEAKQLGKLKEWRAVVEKGIVNSLNKGRHPGEFIPSMIKHLQGTMDQALPAMSDEAKAVVKEIAKLVNENFKSQFYDDIDEMVKNDAAQFFKAAWEETSIGVAEGRVHAPSRCWRKIVLTKLSEHQTAMMQTPIQIPVTEAVKWLKVWLPTYEGKLNPDNIEREFLPLSKRVTTNNCVEAAYYDMRDHLLNKHTGVPLDALVIAWSGPEAPILSAAWVNKLAKEYQDDGKRYAFTQQSFDVMATAFFLDVMKRDSTLCKEWLEAHREDLKTHPKIAELYAQAFPAPKEETHA
jgi:uncharacterized protein (DUF305 family)